MKNRLVTIALIAALVALPYQHLPAEEPPPDDFWLAMCVVAVMGVAGATIYVVGKKCAPKYYWLMDDETPPTFWVGTATRTECEVNGWKRIGGPYNRPQDAPVQHPDPTNVVTIAKSPMKIAAQTSTDGQHWTTEYQVTADWDDFIFFPTNAAGTMIRFEFSAP